MDTYGPGVDNLPGVADPKPMKKPAKLPAVAVERRKEFARQYVLLNNATAAYRVVFKTDKMKDETLRNLASDLLRAPDVADYVEQRKERAAFKFEVTEQMVLEQWWKIATADANQLTRNIKQNCRFCHGVDHAYQWRDSDEWAEAAAAEIVAAEREKRKAEIPSSDGGFGFRRFTDPHVECPRCEGEGLDMPWIADTNKLEGGARVLFAGLKQTRNGVEVLTRDQDAALANIARYLGMFHDRAPGKANGNPLPPGVSLIAKTPQEAAKLYKELMG